MTTYVLVAGAGLGGWTWQSVTRLLEAHGDTVYTPSLTGAGDRAHLLGPGVDLDTHVDDVVNLLHYEDLHDVVLVGHSYGGVVITGAADRLPHRVQKLVYLDAPMGLSHTEIFPAAGDPGQFPRQINDGVEVIVMPSEDLVAFYGITDPDEVAWTLERMTPHPWKASEQRLALTDPTALQALPRYHIVASRTVEMGAHEALPATERAEGRYFEVDGPHALMVIAPHAVTQILTKIASAHPVTPARANTVQLVGDDADVGVAAGLWPGGVSGAFYVPLGVLALDHSWCAAPSPGWVQSGQEPGQEGAPQ